jgi:hypothetical protein
MRGEDRYGMSTFMEYLVRRLTHTKVIAEHSDMLPAEQLNLLVRKEIERVAPLVSDQRSKQDLETFKQINFCRYVSRCMRNAGVPESELDSAVSDTIVKLVVAPGNLMSGWSRTSPLSWRFKQSVKNACITMGQRHATRRRRFHELLPDQPAKSHWRTDNPIHDFRAWLEFEGPPEVLKVFDQRVAGEDLKRLLGTPGLESHFKLKNAVKRLKSKLVLWSHSHPDFLLRVHRMIDDEARTVAKRFRRLQDEPLTANVASPSTDSGAIGHDEDQ